MKRASQYIIPNNPSILIILMGSLGDLVRGLSLVSHIKRSLPDSRITWLVEPAWEKIARRHKGIDRLVLFDRPRGVLAVPALARELAKERFDITFDLQRHFKSGVFSLLSGARRRIGFHRRNAKEFNWLFNNEKIGYHSDRLPKIRHYLKFTEHLGLPTPSRLDFGFSEMDERAEYPGLAVIGGPFVGIVMGSSWVSKDWTFEGYRELAEKILAGGKKKVVLLGDRSKAVEAMDLARTVNDPGLVNLAGKTSLLDLVAVLKAADACVGPDSGPAHLAGAVGTPYVSLFGPTCHVRVAPYGSEDLVVRAPKSCPEAPCYKKQCAAPRCMSTIGADKVMEKLAVALERANMKGRKEDEYMRQ